MQDLRIAARSLLKEAGFSAVLLATLAVGMGATTAIFSIVDTVLLKPLPFSESDQLYRVRNRNSYPDMVDWIEGTTTVTGFGGYNAFNFDLLGAETPERIQGAIVTGDLLPLLGVPAARGRILGPEDNVPGGARLTVLTHEFWTTRMGASPDVLGQTVTLNGEPFEVVGVMPEGFRLPSIQAELLVPHQVVSPETATSRGVHFLIAVGRLDEEHSLEQAQAELDAVAARLEELYPDENTGRRFVLEPWRSSIAADARGSLLMLFAAVGVVLAIACANVAGLLLARTARREREVALRSALGATRGRLVRQLLAESLLLSAIGGALGVGLAVLLTRLVVAIAPADLPRAAEITVNLNVLLFAAVVSMLTGVLFGLAPALQANRVALVAALKEGARKLGAGTPHRTRSSLIVAEMALAVVLLVGAGLVLKSFYRLFEVELGFRQDRLVTMDFLLPMPEFREIQKRVAFFDEVLARLEVLPGVVGVGATTDLPFGSGSVPHNLAVEGRAYAEGSEPEIFYRGVSSSYFEVMGIRLLEGRGFNEGDRQGTLPVVIVNEAFAHAMFPGESPIGKRVRWARRDEIRWMTVVGLVTDVKPSSLDASEVEAVYVPFHQEQDWWRNWMSVAVRADVPVETLERAIPSAVAEIDPAIPVANLRPMTHLIEASASGRRFQLLLLGSFAVVAIFLAAVGLYGLLAYLVTERRSEIGIRLALGAERGAVLRMVLSRGLVLALVGIALGSTAALLLGGLVSSFLFEVSPRDPVTFAAIAFLLLAVTLAASFVPAFRASRVDPLSSIRYE